MPYISRGVTPIEASEEVASRKIAAND